MVKTCVGPREVDLEFVAVYITDQANLDKTALCDLGCILDFVRKHLVSRGLIVPCFDQHRRPVSCRVVVHNKVEIPPRCEFLVCSCVREGELPSDVCVVDPTESLFEKSGLVLTKAVVDPSQESFVVRVLTLWKKWLFYIREYQWVF